jgi:hypothetical protein
MSEDLVKYGTRHYAHPRCYLEKGKPLADLPTWALESFPYFVLKDFGKLDEVVAILKSRKSMRKVWLGVT